MLETSPGAKATTMDSVKGGLAWRSGGGILRNQASRRMPFFEREA